MSVILSKKLLYCYIVILLIAFCLLFLVNAVLANGILPGDATTTATGDYTLNDFVQLFVNVAKWILGISGSLVLLMFVYGGVMLIISGETTLTEGGKASKINKGKSAIRNAIIGLIIVLAAYIIIGFVFKAVGLEDVDWYQSDWFSKLNP